MEGNQLEDAHSLVQRIEREPNRPCDPPVLTRNQVT